MMIAMQPWRATWAIKEIPGGRFEAIRDGRHVGIGRCDEMGEAVHEILHHRCYRTGDHVVARRGRQEWNVDLVAYAPALVGSRS